MARRGRPTLVSSMTARLRGSSAAKERVEVVLKNLAGVMSVQEACSRLSLGRTSFWMLRMTVLEAAVRILEPKRRGRPPGRAPAADRRLQDLERELERMRGELAIARIREEIALFLPKAGVGQKKRRPISARKSATAPSPPPASSTGEG